MKSGMGWESVWSSVTVCNSKLQKTLQQSVLLFLLQPKIRLFGLQKGKQGFIKKAVAIVDQTEEVGQKHWLINWVCFSF